MPLDIKKVREWAENGIKMRGIGFSPKPITPETVLELVKIIDKFQKKEEMWKDLTRSLREELRDYKQNQA